MINGIWLPRVAPAVAGATLGWIPSALQAERIRKLLDRGQPLHDFGFQAERSGELQDSA
jgi:hypothetical protein